MVNKAMEYRLMTDCLPPTESLFYMITCEEYDVLEIRKKRQLHTFVFIVWALFKLLLSATPQIVKVFKT